MNLTRLTFKESPYEIEELLENKVWRIGYSYLNSLVKDGGKMGKLIGGSPGMVITYYYLPN